MPKRNAQGAGSIRQRKDGKWEARYTVGRHPGTGKQIQKSVYGDTQKEVLKKLQQIQNDMENGTYVEPSKLTVGAWLDAWLKTYTRGVKESTQASYGGHIKNHIKPSLGAALLQKLTPLAVQKFYNRLSDSGLSAKTVKNIHGVLHQALEEAVKQDYIKKNPAKTPTLPRVIKPDIKVMDNEIVAAFIKAINGHQFEAIYFVDLFSGMRQAEILGLTWDCVKIRLNIFLDFFRSPGQRSADFIPMLPSDFNPAFAVNNHMLYQRGNKLIAVL